MGKRLTYGKKGEFMEKRALKTKLKTHLLRGRPKVEEGILRVLNARPVAFGALIPVLVLLISFALCGGRGRAEGAFKVPEISYGAPEALKEKLDGILRGKIEGGELSGAVLIVSKDGELIYRGAFGWSDREKGEAMEIDSVFRLASVSKAYVAMAAGVLIGSGKLRLDEPIGKYLPMFSYANKDLFDKRALRITVGHLLSHKAGFNYKFLEEPGGPYHREGVSDGCESSPGLSLNENMSRIAKSPLLYAPGTSHGYSVASDVLGGLLSEAYGKSLPSVMDELVLKPLEITDTGFVAKDASKLSAHYRSGKPFPKRMGDMELFKLGKGRTLVLSPGRATDPNEFPSGGCGMVGSADSLILLLEALRKDGGGLINPETTELFFKDAIAPETSSPGEGFGASWGVLLDPKKAKLPLSPGSIHWGGVYGHNWYVDKKRGISVALLTNTALGGLSGNAKDLVLEALNEAYPVN